MPDASSTEVVWVEWGATDRAVPTLVVRAPEDRDASYELELEVRQGPFTFAWVEGPFVVAAGTSEERAVVIPLEVAAAPYASTYLSRLVVFVVGGFPSGLDHVFVAWPDGPAGAPVVWDRSEVGRYAPYGITDPATEAAILSGQAEEGLWVEPPSSVEGHESLPDRDSPLPTDLDVAEDEP